MNHVFFKRGSVFRIKLPPFDLSQKGEAIIKYVLNLQQGKVVEKVDTFVCLLITTEPQKLKKLYKWDVLLSPDESHTAEGAKVCCNQVYTIPKEKIIDYVYSVSNTTMLEVDRKLVIGLCMRGLEI